MGKLFLLTASIGFFAIHSYGQNIIKGTVFNKRGIAVPGISVSIKQTNYGATANHNGVFEIITPFPADTSLVVIISGKGYKSIEKLSQHDSLYIYMDDDVLNLDEVVVTGSNVNVSRKMLGNSISTIDQSEMMRDGTNHLSGILGGKIMGGIITQNTGDPGGGYSLKLRGVGSVFSSSESLYILDGLVIDNSSVNMVNLNVPGSYQTGTNRLIDINYHDIERVEVINGPAAAAIYGSRAANGVVQLFTKKGQKGKPQVVFSTSVNHNSFTNRIKVNEYPFRFGIKKGSDLDSSGDRRTMLFNLRPNKNLVRGGGPVSYTGELDTAMYAVNRYDYQDDIFESSWGTDQYLSISGGGDNGNYYLSGSFLDNGGIMKGTNFNRYSLNIRSNYKLNHWIQAGGSLVYSRSRSDEMPNSFQQFSPIGAMNHTDNVYDIDKRDSAGNLRMVEYAWMNPLTPIETYELSVETNRTIGGINFRLTPWGGFALSGAFGIDTYAQQGFTYQPRVPYPFLPANLFPDGYVSQSKLNYQQWSADISASYTTNLAKKISSVTVGGFSGQQIQSTFQSQEGRNLLSYGRTIQAAQNLFTAPVDQRTKQRIYGYFLQETFGYNKLLYVTVAGRFDASSAFGANVGNVFYPKAGMSLNLSDMKFWKNSSIHHWFTTLHLRAAYGKAGNLTGLGAYDRFTTVTPVTYYNSVGGFVPASRKGNEDIRPETKTEWEAGADMQFLGDRLYSKITFYKQTIKDLIIPYNWAPSNGYYSILDNIGSMQNNGMELMVGGFPVKGKRFTWEISMLYNAYKNKVIDLGSNKGFVGITPSQGAVEGFPIGVYYGNYYARNNDGSLLLTDNNGFLLPQPEKGDPVKNLPDRRNGQPYGTPINKVLGSPNPDYSATLMNTLTYKNLRFSIQIDRLAGMEMFNWTRIIRNNVGNAKIAEQELSGLLTRGWVGAVGGQITGPFIQEEAVEDASFTKIRTISLSYKWSGLKGIRSMEFVLTGRNLFTFTSYDGFDPETSTAGQSIIRGTDYGSYPIPRVVQFTIVTTF